VTMLPMDGVGKKNNTAALCTGLTRELRRELRKTGTMVAGSRVQLRMATASSTHPQPLRGPGEKTGEKTGQRGKIANGSRLMRSFSWGQPMMPSTTMHKLMASHHGGMMSPGESGMNASRVHRRMLAGLTDRDKRKKRRKGSGIKWLTVTVKEKSSNQTERTRTATNGQVLQKAM